MKQTLLITIFEHVHNPFPSLMRFTLSLLLIFAAISSTSTAQNLPPILKTVKPKRGIYATFDEFLNDAPSVQLKFVLQERSRSKQFWAGGSEFTLLIPDGKGGMKKANKYWGLCDGDSIYINVSNYQKTQGYIKLLQLGRFCEVSVEKVNYFQCLYRESDMLQVVPRDSKEGDYYVRQLKYLAEHPRE